jgi:flavin reductase (DIM6/NTAB) family NADH-FMN oxidoreductase RutF
MPTKHDFPVENVRAFLEPGPIVLVSSHYKGKHNIMTMGWHMILGEQPSLVGCFIWDQNHSREMIRKSRECVINVPDVKLAKAGDTFARWRPLFKKSML